jgi:hypothetical protein
MRLFVVVEGDTEIAFAKATLAPHLHARNVWTLPIEVTSKRDRKTGQKLGRGGGHWKHWRKDIVNLSKSNPGSDVRITTLFDLYGLPNDFPELSSCEVEQDTTVRAGLLESAMAKDIDDHRFLPYLQRHEFEALVLAGLDKLPALLPGQLDRAGVESLQRSLGDLCPEDVNDGNETAPSKRLVKHIPGYRKVTMGPSVIDAFGLAALRAKCPRFDAWIAKLEALGDPQ